MKRNLVKLSACTYDLAIIGGGIYGACVAWEATLRGLSVALVEKGDFGSETSANSLKIIHGGLRYLQNADFKRMRESIQERKTLMRIAPHLVHPLPLVIPTYGHGIKGKEVLGLAIKINDLISFDRNQLKDPQKHIPNGRLISPRECQHLLPAITNQRLTGGAIFYDAQVYNSERLTLAFILSAEQAGATVVNYSEVRGFLQTGNCVTGVEVTDILTGDRFEIRAKTVVNTCGAWINNVLSLLKGEPKPKTIFAKAMNLVVRNPLFGSYGAGISSSRGASDQPNRFLFIAPWRGKSMIGTYYAGYDGKPEDFQITELDIQNFLQHINQIYSLANLTQQDVSFVHGGLLPRISIDSKTGEPLLAKNYQIKDYSEEGLSGIVSVVGVKYTTARDVAQKTVDRIFQLWGQKPPKSTSAFTPLYGGKIDRFETFLQDAIAKLSSRVEPEVMRRLVYNYGSAYRDILQYLEPELDDTDTIDNLAVLKAEVLHAVHKEMAQKLSDIVFRRTELGSAEYPGSEPLKLCAETMGAELGWNHTRIKQEIQAVNDVYKNKFLVPV
ncbi:MAG: FAD-dependent oxidoreductase [Xenococcaceae cyanobacterium]